MNLQQKSFPDIKIMIQLQLLLSHPEHMLRYIINPEQVEKKY